MIDSHNFRDTALADRVIADKPRRLPFDLFDFVDVAFGSRLPDRDSI